MRKISSQRTHLVLRPIKYSMIFRKKQALFLSFFTFFLYYYNAIVYRRNLCYTEKKYRKAREKE